MASYIVINFDTTSPDINLYAPKYTTKQVNNVITIESNEELSSFQEIYVIDGHGVRHDYIFQKETLNKYVGYITFNDFDYGIITIYARVEDIVGNVSKVVSSTIEIREEVPLLNLVINDRVAKISTSISDMRKDTDISDMDIDTNSRVAKLITKYSEG